MSAAGGAPWRPLAGLGVVVLATHVVVLRGVPPAIDWRHLQGAMTFRVHDAQPQRPLDVPARAEPAPVPAPTPAGVPAPAVAPSVSIAANPAPRRPRATPTASGQPQPAPTAAPLPALPLPPASVWRYAVTAITRGTVRNGTADLAWRPDGDRYTASLHIAVPGGPTRTQASEGSLSRSGLEPLRFSDRIRSEEATHFDRAQGRIVFSSNRPDAVLEPGAQDRLSVLLQVGAMVAADPARFAPGATLTLQAATTREATAWTFTVDGEELLALPGGALPALKLTRAPQREYDLRIELWLAPGQAYGPVRLRLTPPNGDWLDAQWSGTDKG